MDGWWELQGGEVSRLNRAWKGVPGGLSEVELGGFCGCQGLGGKRKELGKRPRFSLSLRQNKVGGEGVGLDYEFVLDIGVCAVALWPSPREQVM